MGDTCDMIVRVVPVADRCSLPALLPLWMSAATPFRAASISLTAVGPARWCDFCLGVIAAPLRTHVRLFEVVSGAYELLTPAVPGAAQTAKRSPLAPPG